MYIFLTNRINRVIYTGVTNDLVRRMYEHKHHLDKSSFTAQYNIDKLVYYEEISSSRAAIQREKQIKSWSRKKKDQLIQNKNPDWQDLYDSIL